MRLLLFCLVSAMVLSGCGKLKNEMKLSRFNNYTDWGIYRGDQKGNQFSELDQIDTSNVHLLESVWTYHTGDHTDKSAFQANPLIIDGWVYIVSPGGRLIALDAVTGEEKWVFDARIGDQLDGSYSVINRGLTYWESEDGLEKQLFHALEMNLYAVDPKTGERVEGFADKGVLDLRKNLGVDPDSVSLEATSPGVVFEDFYILGQKVGESHDSSPGHIRAWDVRTGEFRWIFHTIPQEGEFGFDTWEFVEGETYGGANPWGGLTVDEQRGWVFAATGSPTYDFYGANRKGQNLFGNCVVALDARTGKRIWHYQTVHHDLWDMDNPPAPILVTLNQNGFQRDAVVQMTKMGWLFVLDRNTGKPIFPVEERPVPPSSLPGEEAWPTQPYPTKPPALVRQGFSEADLSDVTPDIHTYVSDVFKNYQGVSMYTPHSLIGQVMLPGMSGGMEYHGASFDPGNQMLYVNVNEMPNLIDIYPITTLVDDSELSSYDKGRILYQHNCIACHGLHLQGAPPIYPSLQNLGRTDQELKTSIRLGKGVMPPFRNFSGEELNGLIEYLRNPSDEPLDTTGLEVKTTYLLEGYKRFFDNQGHPAIKPPWGSLAAVDLNVGEIKWKVPLGEYPDLVAKGIRNTGTLNWGGAVATAGGIIFIAATGDEKIRAFESATGKVLWEHKLPFGGNATPAVYEIEGRQFVVICAGGGPKTPVPSGDVVVAFALPE